MPRPRPLALAALAGLALAGCTQAGAPEPSAAAAGVTPSGFALPAGSGCAGEIARYRAVVDNDLATGHVDRSVHARIAAELDRAAASCTAGRDAEAVRMVAATRSRFGY
jgi:hypothetical protein